MNILMAARIARDDLTRYEIVEQKHGSVASRQRIAQTLRLLDTEIKKSCKRSQLVEFRYPDNGQHFREVVFLTEKQEEILRARLQRAEDSGRIEDVTISDVQDAPPTPFKEFLGTIRAVEEGR